MDELTREFLIESQEGLDRMERCLTELEERPQDAGLIGDIFRSVHTIKGTTGFLGFKRLEKLAHAGENLLGLLREDRFDFIFLRNVMLYFSQETRRALLANIHRLLAPDGVLFLGSSEQPADPSIWAPALAGGTCHFRPRQPS